MILSPSVLLPEIARGQLIQNLSEREIKNPEGAGFDLRVGSISRIEGPGSLLVETRETSPVCELGTNKNASDTIIDLVGGGLYLLTTIETFSLESHMLAFFHPRSTLFRSGVVFQSGVAPYGYKGCMTFLLYVANQAGFQIQIGARFAHVNVLAVNGESSPYRGQWQHGRVTTTQIERQI
jgi:deoxycytidine triphosphate deaminase